MGHVSAATVSVTLSPVGVLLQLTAEGGPAVDEVEQQEHARAPKQGSSQLTKLVKATKEAAGYPASPGISSGVKVNLSLRTYVSAFASVLAKASA